ncbi:MAG: hypothetical protein ACR2HH_00035 [Chthoniobacterales bacterium]
MNNSGSGVPSNHFGTLPPRADARSRFSRFGKFLGRTRCLPLLVLTLACLLIREQFPFSNFPMYSSFSSHTFYIFVADAAGQPLAAATLTGTSTATWKKIYVSEMKKESERLRLGKTKMTPAQEAVVGEKVLRQVRNLLAADQSVNLPDGLSLYEVAVDLRAGHFEKKAVRIATLP